MPSNKETKSNIDISELAYLQRHNNFCADNEFRQKNPPGAMDDRDGWRESSLSILSIRLTDDL